MRIVLLSLLILCSGCHNPASKENQPTDYQQEIEKLNKDIDELKQKLTGSSNEADALRFVYYLYLRASLTGDFIDYKKTETALQKASNGFGVSQQLLLFRANFNFKLHRLQQTRSDLAALDRYGGSPHAEILKADIALQMGQYAVAEQAYSAIAAENPSWDNLARLAYLRYNTGAPDLADALYQQAQDQLSVKEMRNFAWLELQRGILDLEFKRYPQALDHYLRADFAYSGYWLIREHIAEVLALLGRKDEAVELYKKIIAQTKNPEFISALAALYEGENNPEAAALYRQADALFNQQYQLYPEAAAGHFVESLLTREQANPLLLEYAGRNHLLRPNAYSKYLLAKTHFKLGNQALATNLMAEVLDSPWRTPDIESFARELKLP